MELNGGRPQREVQAPVFQQWFLPDGRIWTRFYRLPDCFLLRFPGLADFQLDNSGRGIKCFPALGISNDTVWHLYHSQILPLALSLQGKLVFHASAVQIDSGAVAFMGASGKGKSTLAASFGVNNCAFLTDDGLLLERDADEIGWVAVPSQPSLRLWRDAQFALVGERADAAAALEFTSKGRFLAGSDLSHCSVARPLTAIYVLGDGSAATPTFHTLSPSQALIELVKHSFLLDINERHLLAAHFDALSQVLERVPCTKFDYPRCFESLDVVRRSLMDDVRTRCLQ